MRNHKFEQFYSNHYHKITQLSEQYAMLYEQKFVVFFKNTYRVITALSVNEIFKQIR